jgi:hypothetical protein
MDFDPWRWVAIPVWGLVLLVSPLVVGIAIWQMAGFAIAAVVSVVCLVALRFLFSDRLLFAWHLTSALNGRHIVEQMPVVLARVRARDGQEVQIRLKGPLEGGNLMEGDRIEAQGRWRSGVLNVRQIRCQRTGAAITPRQPCAQRLALLGLGILAVAGLWLAFAGLPWVSARYSSFLESSQRQTTSPFENSYENRYQ